MRKFYALLAGVCLFASAAWAQAPLDNPYRTAYSPAGGHWTDQLRWYYVRPVTDFGAIANDNQDDYAAIQAGIDTLHAAGGGVLYFPTGMYNSSQSLIIKSNVILRGADLTTGFDDPMTPTFEPSSKLWFPQYVFDTLANGGAGVDNSTAFKLIEGQENGRSMGLVNLDINRAVIKFQPKYNLSPGAPFSTPQPIDTLMNVLVFGVRSNNAVLDDPAVPTSQQKPWQRLPWRFSTNIDIMVGANAVVARCRLNDGVPKDNFMMEGYVIEFRGSGGWRPLTLAQRPLFDYDAHYAISVNRKKTFRDVNGKWGIGGYVGYANPNNEPVLFAPNIEILDNWMYKTNRVAIIAAGNGLTIKGNVMKDDVTKQSRTDFLGPTGRLTPQGATTFENRGIDFSGWNCRIEDNDVEAYRHLAGGYLSTDGEGILVQECCGGTSVNDYTIKGNYMRTSNYIGIYKMRDCHNVDISDNDLRGGPVWLWANTNGGTYALHNCRIANNTAVGGIDANGTVTGTNTFIEDNQGSGSIKAPCYAVVQNNTGFSSVTYNSGGGVSCLPRANFPAVVMAGGSDSTFCAQPADSILLVKATLRAGDLNTALIDLYLNSTRIATNLVPDLVDSSVRYYFRLPPGNGQYSFTAIVRQGADLAYSLTRTFYINCVVSTKPEAKRAAIAAYPNPGSGKVTLQLAPEAGTLRLTDLSGRTLHTQVLSADQAAQALPLDLTGRAAGTYIISYQTASGYAVTRYVKQ